jgi:hypothetical protein
MYVYSRALVINCNVKRERQYVMSREFGIPCICNRECYYRMSRALVIWYIVDGERSSFQVQGFTSTSSVSPDCSRLDISSIAITPDFAYWESRTPMQGARVFVTRRTFEHECSGCGVLHIASACDVVYRKYGVNVLIIGSTRDMPYYSYGALAMRHTTYLSVRNITQQSLRSAINGIASAHKHHIYMCKQFKYVYFITIDSLSCTYFQFNFNHMQE